MRASFITYFREIAEEEYQVYLPLLVHLKALHDPAAPFFSDEELVASVKMEKICIKMLIFLASYLESFIWDFAASYLGEKDAERLDKLSTLDKWEIIPRLVNGRSLEMKAHQLDRFRRLIQERNKLMHHKSIDLRPYINKEVPINQFPKDLVNIWQRLDMTDFIKAADYLVAELNEAFKQTQAERNKKHA